MDQKNNKKDIEARKLIAQIQSGDTEAEARLVELHKEFTASVMRQYKGKGLSDEEITSACESALIRSARKFDLDKDFAFISYAIWWMKDGVLQAQKAKRMEKINQFLHNMTKTELENYDALKAIIAQLENSQDMTITVVATVGELDFTEEITIPKEAWDKIVESATYEVKCSIEDEEGMNNVSTPDVAYHLNSRGITMAGILDKCNKLKEMRNSMLADLLANEECERDEYSLLEGIEDFKVAMCGYNDADEDMSDKQIVFMHDDYPQILLDEIAAKL